MIEVELKRIADALEKIAGTQAIAAPAATPAAEAPSAAPKTRAARALATALSTPATAPAAAPAKEADPFEAESTPAAKVYTTDEVRKILQDKVGAIAAGGPAEAVKAAQAKVLGKMKEVTGQDNFKKVTEAQYSALVTSVQALN